MITRSLGFLPHGENEAVWGIYSSLAGSVSMPAEPADHGPHRPRLGGVDAPPETPKRCSVGGNGVTEVIASIENSVVLLRDPGYTWSGWFVERGAYVTIVYKSGSQCLDRPPTFRAGTLATFTCDPESQT